MPVYDVSGLVTVRIHTTVEADSEEEAMQIAEDNFSGYYLDYNTITLANSDDSFEESGHINFDTAEEV